MESTWVDFKAVKAAVSMERVLDHYGVGKLKRVGDELRGRCPIHKGEGEDAFHVSLAKNCFHCFSCKKKGNVLDFVAAMESCNMRDAAIKLQEWFSTTKAAANGGGKPSGSVGGGGENVPLTFRLKDVDCNHAYLAERGILKETAEFFWAGFFPGKGSMSGRVVIPIHNERGELLAYAGRAIDGTEPKYKLPAGFKKSLVLYNLHRAIDAGTVVLVEGFFDCMKVHQAGIPCVALMGCALSEEQERLLLENFSGVILLLDGDDAGRKAADELLLRLGRKVWVKAVDVEGGRQPDELTTEEILTFVFGKIRLP